MRKPSALGPCLCGFGMNERQFGARLTADGASFGCGRRRRSVSICCWQTQAMQRGKDGWFLSMCLAQRPAPVQIPDRRRDRCTRPGFGISADDVSGPAKSSITQAIHGGLALAWTSVARNRRDGSPCRHLTQEGTYRAMIGKLDHLVESGITALELMPLADSPARATGL